MTIARLVGWMSCVVLIGLVAGEPVAAAPNPCRVACKGTKKTCVQDATTAFVAARTACATQPTPAERRACKRAARATRTSSLTACKAQLTSCLAACRATTTTVPGGGTTTTTIATCGDPEGAAVVGITAAHNDVRANAAPAPASALSPLCYSATVAADAQTWADGCQFMHDSQRLQNLGLGENLYATSGNATATAAAAAVPAWACEAGNYDYAANTCSLNGCPNAAGVCGHYTQLVWGSTTHVGCAVKYCTTNSPFGQGFPTWTFVVCDYSPPGNYIGQRPY
jgi:hypothetical protein